MAQEAKGTKKAGTDKTTSPVETQNNQEDLTKFIKVPAKFAFLTHLITRDLNNNTTTSAFTLYSKNDVAKYLANPNKYEKQLRKAIQYIYGASPHFRRLIQYFVGLSDLSYIVEPYRMDPKRANVKTVNSNYRKVLNILSSMNIKTQIPKILTVALRDDVFYGTLWVTSDSITIQHLPSDFCAISSIEGNVINVSFDFSYFNSRQSLLKNYPVEFRKKYEIYKEDMKNRWIELDSPTSFAIKCSTDILDYALPPFAGILREVYELEDYKQLKLTKTELENYALLFMQLPLQPDGSWGLDLDKAKEFWRNLDAVLPEEVGSVLTPMPVNKIGFERSNTGDIDTVADGERSLYTAAGVSSLLFNNEKASANALLLSIKADQTLTFGIMKSIEDAINRFLQAQAYGKNFKINFLDVSPFNRKEVGDAYLKAASYGIPTISAYAASQGIGQAELDGMSFLEGDVLGLQKMFKPIRSSTQMSSQELEGNGATDDGGAPTKGVGEISDSGEQNQEDA